MLFWIPFIIDILFALWIRFGVLHDGKKISLFAVLPLIVFAFIPIISILALIGYFVLMSILAGKDDISLKDNKLNRFLKKL